MEDSLLVSLRSYHPRPDRDPLEDFITEAFAWTLRTHPSVESSFLEWIDDKADVQVPNDDRVDWTWTTQKSLDGGIADMVVSGGGRTYIFEHKVWDRAEAKQIDNYRKSIDAEEIVTVLITAAKWKYERPEDDSIPDPDVHTTWASVSQTFSRLEDGVENPTRIQDFIALLDHEGLGPREILEEPQLRAFNSHQKTLSGLSKLIKELKKQPRKWDFAYDLLPDLDGKREPGSKWTHNPPRYGRISLILYTEGNINIHFGILLDPSDIQTELTNPNMGPDIAVHLKIPWKNLTQKQYDEILHSDAYNHLVSKLTTDDLGNWTLFEIKSDYSQNKHHPVVLQQPLAPILRGKTTVDDQRQVLTDKLQDGLQRLLQTNEIGKIRKLVLERLDS